mmetsp:Transcript_93140/g.207175  ORF Transcript_93140/g.207175 Transcript_93140/m.207175 type:complete len:387 (+) Transcript_93140:835-1995(+)
MERPPIHVGHPRLPQSHNLRLHQGLHPRLRIIEELVDRLSELLLGCGLQQSDAGVAVGILHHHRELHLRLGFEGLGAIPEDPSLRRAHPGFFEEACERHLVLIVDIGLRGRVEDTALAFEVGEELCKRVRHALFVELPWLQLHVELVVVADTPQVCSAAQCLIRGLDQMRLHADRREGLEDELPVDLLASPPLRGVVVLSLLVWLVDKFHPSHRRGHREDDRHEVRKFLERHVPEHRETEVALATDPRGHGIPPVRVRALPLLGDTLVTSMRRAHGLGGGPTGPPMAHCEQLQRRSLAAPAQPDLVCHNVVREGHLPRKATDTPGVSKVQGELYRTASALAVLRNRPPIFDQLHVLLDHLAPPLHPLGPHGAPAQRRRSLPKCRWW